MFRLQYTDRELWKILSKDAKREIRDAGSYFRSLTWGERYELTERLRTHPELQYINWRQLARMIWQAANS